MKFRKESIVVDAFQTPVDLAIHTWSGDSWVTASAGDWIITGPDGEVSVCKPVIFAKTYEPVETEEK